MNQIRAMQVLLSLFLCALSLTAGAQVRLSQALHGYWMPQAYVRSVEMGAANAQLAVPFYCFRVEAGALYALATEGEFNRVSLRRVTQSRAMVYELSSSFLPGPPPAAPDTYRLEIAVGKLVLHVLQRGKTVATTEFTRTVRGEPIVYPALLSDQINLPGRYAVLSDAPRTVVPLTIDGRGNTSSPDFPRLVLLRDAECCARDTILALGEMRRAHRRTKVVLDITPVQTRIYPYRIDSACGCVLGKPLLVLRKL